jgi:hypothetical protein
MNCIIVRRFNTALATAATLSAFTVGALMSAVSTGAFAHEAEHRLGEHPAVIVKRLSANEGVDYASIFYPHPAWLYWSMEPPRELSEHPAVIVFRRYQREQSCTSVAAASPAERRHEGDEVSP